MPYLYDILALCLLLRYIYQASHQGLVATLVRMAGYAAALLAAWPLAREGAARLFEFGLREGLLTRVTEHLAENPEGGELIESAARMLEALPAYASKLLGMDSVAMERLSQRLEAMSDDGARIIVDEVLSPVVTGALSIILFVLVFSLLLLVVRLVTRMFVAANGIPVIGPVNSILGGTAGLVMGVVALYVLLLILKLVILLTGDSFAFLNTGLLSDTVTYRLLRRIEPFGLL